MLNNDDYELLDIVDDNDAVIGVINRGDIGKLRDTPGRYVRAVEMFIQRSKGDIYLPRRSAHKKIAPGGYDLSVAGHLNSGETYEQACIREVKEEVGIDANIDDLLLIARVKPSLAIPYFRNIYLYKTDKEPQLSSEHTEAIWVRPNELENMIQNDIPTKETLYEDVAILQEYLKSV